MRALLASFLALSCVASCTRHETPPPIPSASPAPPAASASAPVSAAPAPEAVLVDLLYRTRARVAVSSNVHNPKDYPEHLIDGRPETAWNGKTGDLDAFVTFQVPASVRVRKILVIPGYDRVTKEGDLFTMNHRIAKVALERDGVLVGEFDLDVENRKPQAIAVDQPGGTFVLRPEVTVPGTRDTWKEVVISELSVLGNAPPEALVAPSMPQVVVGPIDAQIPLDAGPLDRVYAEAPFPSTDALCARARAVESGVLAKIKARDRDDVFLDELKPACAPSSIQPKKKALAPPFAGAMVLAILEGTVDVDRVVMATDKGWFATGIQISRSGVGPGCGMSSGEEVDWVETQSGVLTMHVTKRSARWGRPEGENFDSAAAFFIACTLDSNGAPACREELVASLEDDWVGRSTESGHWIVQPSRWDWTRTAVADDTGGIRLGPCVDEKGAEKVCTRRNADLLRRD